MEDCIEVLVRRMYGVWKAKKSRKGKTCLYFPYLCKARELAKEFQHIQFIWITREENTEADALSRMVLSPELKGKVRLGS